MKVTYFHPVKDHEGKRLSTANIIWAQRDLGSSYYRYSEFGMRAGKFPPTHPCAPFNSSRNGSEFGGSPSLESFRARGYWASCFPEGDGITMKWWEDVPEPTEKTPDEVMHDIRECFGWEVVDGQKAN